MSERLTLKRNKRSTSPNAVSHEANRSSQILDGLENNTVTVESSLAGSYTVKQMAYDPGKTLASYMREMRSHVYIKVYVLQLQWFHS